VNESLIFIVVAALLLVLVIVYFWAALKSAVFKARLQPLDAREVMISNVAVYREQLTELAAEFELGRLNENEFEAAREELAQRLMEDSQQQTLTSQTVQALRGETPFESSDTLGLGASKVRSPWIRWTLPTLAVFIPVLAISLYIAVGSPGALDFVDTQSAGTDEAFTPEKLADMAVELNKRLVQEPNNADGWVMLARVERSLSHFEVAEKALSKALSLSDNDDVQIERAEVLAQINHGSFKGEPWAIIQKVLKANPDQGNALLLAGSAAFTENRYTDALKYWQKVQRLVAPSSADAAALAEAIAKAQERAGIKTSAAPSSLKSESPVISNNSASPPNVQSSEGAQTSLDKGKDKQKSASHAAQLVGRVLVSSALASKTHPTDIVFIYAVPVSGSRMPLAMIKTTVDKLPYYFELNDTNAMNPAATLSSVDEVMVKARISVSGNAMPQPGDFGVTIGPVKVGAQNLNLTISEALK